MPCHYLAFSTRCLSVNSQINCILYISTMTSQSWESSLLTNIFKSSHQHCYQLEIVITWVFLNKTTNQHLNWPSHKNFSIDYDCSWDSSQQLSLPRWPTTPLSQRKARLAWNSWSWAYWFQNSRLDRDWAFSWTSGLAWFLLGMTKIIESTLMKYVFNYIDRVNSNCLI